MEFKNILAVIIGIAGVFIFLITIFSIFGGIASNLQDSANNLSNSGLPIAMLFSPSGLLLFLLMGLFLIVCIGVIVFQVTGVIIYKFLK